MAPAGSGVAEHLPGLVSTDTLAAWERRGRVSLLDVRPDMFIYLKEHLPGAGYLNTETLRASEAGVPAQLLPAAAYGELFRGSVWTSTLRS